MRNQRSVPTGRNPSTRCGFQEGTARFFAPLRMTVVPDSRLPTADLPTADLPTADLPTADLPTADLPTADRLLPKVVLQGCLGSEVAAHAMDSSTGRS